MNKDRICLALATCFGLGLSPYFPGTCGALVGVAIYLPFAYLIPSEPAQSLVIAAALIVWSAITVAVGDVAERHFRKKDAGSFVSDEVAGLLLTVLLWRIYASPLITMLWAFPVTRIIDMVKVPPAKQLERLPSGWGVLADDLLGSIYAAGLLHLLSWTFPDWFASG